MTPETLRQRCKPETKMFETFCESPWEEVGLYWWGADCDLIHPCPLQLLLTPRTHVQIPIGALHQSPREKPKLPLTSSDATWNQSRPTSHSIPTPRCYCFPLDICQNCHLTMRTWYVEKCLWFMHWHHHWLSVCSYTATKLIKKKIISWLYTLYI